MSSAPVAIKGMYEQTGSDEIALREPLYVFAVSDLLNSYHDRRSERVYELIDNRPLARPNKTLMPVDNGYGSYVLALIDRNFGNYTFPITIPFSAT